MFEVLIFVYIVVSVALIGFILIQQGKGADMGASFGSGGSSTVFGSSGAGNFLTKSTSVLATIFFVLCLLLGGMSAKKAETTDEFTDLQAPAAEQMINEEIPAAEKVVDEIPE
ncbi:preprotein translocase subunit SecG [Catenovulum agarivorans DS-2]|uniref:Protein-export membrane protein SecG n=1 Tax=Catenovulum agarivorans DS-2 TaxID=1328313 RepID=W7QK92_9ALTE|nr:preprotein translocase subunit SecG [Catenovulum agarivorans]EWH08533.1 preprotein translocase subunit SecG [Catenovulum agarivorans DS-2]